MSFTSAGTTLAISAGLPASLDGQGYQALVYTEIVGVESISAFGPNTATAPFQPLAGLAEKNKGGTNYGSLQVPIAVDKSDPGQALLWVAGDPVNRAMYAFLVTFTNGDRRFFLAKVFGVPETPGAATNNLMATASIEIITPIWKINTNDGVLDFADPQGLATSLLTGVL
jgi:hypothetical protein